jgi:NADP-dependent aldehyde dehydrogenase
MIKGQHFINGQWLAGDSTFRAACLNSEPSAMPNANPALVDLAAESAHRAFQKFSHAGDAERARLLFTIAAQIDADKDHICAMAHEETGLSMPRLQGECQRTTDQLRLFADFIGQGKHLDTISSPAVPDRQPMARPEIHCRMRPIGPVAVFGAANFPLAFSTAGGDTAAALAAGCPVVVKGHPAHPATSELVAQAVARAMAACDTDPGVFGLLQDSGHAAASQLVQHPCIKAVGFTGSLHGGRALFDLCAQRPQPIPFFGEMGSVNPVFVLPGRLSENPHPMARGWAQALNLGVGQFCTKPGLLVVPEGAAGDQFIATAIDELQSLSTPANMLTQLMADDYARSIRALTDLPGINILMAANHQGRQVTPHVISTSHAEWISNPKLRDELFGPFAVVLRVADVDQMQELTEQLDGQLTATLLCDDADQSLAKTLINTLEHKAGRLIINGFPTGVEVVDAMVHGGPYPASTCASASSVGTLAIKRFLRPVAYQNVPADWQLF